MGAVEVIEAETDSVTVAVFEKEGDAESGSVGDTDAEVVREADLDADTLMLVVAVREPSGVCEPTSVTVSDVDGVCVGNGDFDRLLLSECVCEEEPVTEAEREMVVVYANDEVGDSEELRGELPLTVSVRVGEWELLLLDVKSPEGVVELDAERGDADLVCVVVGRLVCVGVS